MAKPHGLNNYVNIIGEVFSKLPNLSYKSQKAVVDVVPYLALIFGTLGVGLTFVALGIFTVFEPIAQVTGIKGTGGNFFFVLLSLISSLLLLTSFAGLQKKQISGWNRVYLSRVIAFAGNLFPISFEGLLLSLVSFYILYRIRAHYK